MLCCASCRQTSSPSPDRSPTKDANATKKDNGFSDVAIATQPFSSPSVTQPAQQHLAKADASQSLNLPESKIPISDPLAKPVFNPESIGATHKSASVPSTTISLNTNLTTPPGPATHVSITPTSMASQVSVKEETLLKEINKLSETVEKAAAGSGSTGREVASVYASQLKALTSQVRKEAGSMSESALNIAVSRLEAVAARLESLTLQGGRGGGTAESGETLSWVQVFWSHFHRIAAIYNLTSSTIVPVLFFFNHWIPQHYLELMVMLQ